MSKLTKQQKTELEQGILRTLKNHKVTVKLIRSLGPCYDPVTGLDEEKYVINEGYLEEGYKASLLEFLQHPKVPYEDKIWLLRQSSYGTGLMLNTKKLWGLVPKYFKDSKLLTSETTAKTYITKLVAKCSKLLKKDKEKRKLAKQVLKLLKLRVTPKLIRQYNPCYDPVTGKDRFGYQANEGYLKETYSDTLFNFLKHKDIPADDIYWFAAELIPHNLLPKWIDNIEKEAELKGVHSSELTHKNLIKILRKLLTKYAKYPNS